MRALCSYELVEHPNCTALRTNIATCTLRPFSPRGEGQVEGVRTVEFGSEASEPLTRPLPSGEREITAGALVAFLLTCVPVAVTV